MNDCAELIEHLNVGLSEFGYAGDNNIAIPNTECVVYINNRALFKAKSLCAVINMPGNINNIAMAKRFFKFLKDSLLHQYGDAFLWKELEMCFIVLCDEKLYKLLEGNEDKVVSEASFCLRALLVTCFVNKDNFDNKTVSTWGIYFAGDQFKSVDKIVSQWCESQRTARSA